MKGLETPLVTFGTGLQTPSREGLIPQEQSPCPVIAGRRPGNPGPRASVFAAGVVPRHKRPRPLPWIPGTSPGMTGEVEPEGRINPRRKGISSPFRNVSRDSGSHPHRSGWNARRAGPLMHEAGSSGLV